MSKATYWTSLTQLSKLLSNIKQEKQLRSFLEDILTPQEIIVIGERIQLCRQLIKWKTQRIVADEMGVSITTVNRGARMLKFGTSVLKDVLM